MTSVGMERAQPRTRRRGAFARIYSQHFGLVWSVVRRSGVPEAAREDVAQDAWVAIYRNLDRLRTSASARAFVVAFARNVALHHHRARGRRERKHDAIAMVAEPPQGAVQRAEARDVVFTLLEEMDDAQALVFLLVHGHGLTGREIADALDESVNTIHSRLRLARRHARRFAEERELEERALDSRLRLEDDADPELRRRMATALAAELPLAAAGSAAVGSFAAFAVTTVLGVGALAGVAVILPPEEGSQEDVSPATVETPPQSERVDASATLPSELAGPPATVLPEKSAAATVSSESAPPPARGRASAPSPAEVGEATVEATLAAEAELLRRVKGALDRGDASAALSLLDRHVRQFPQRSLDDVGRGLRVRALCAVGKVAQARGEAAALAKDRPGSAVAEGTKDACRGDEAVAVPGMKRSE